VHPSHVLSTCALGKQACTTLRIHMAQVTSRTQYAGGYPGYAAPHADPALQGWGAAPQGGGYAAGYSAAPGGYGAAQQHYSGDQHYDRERERDNRDGRGGRDRDRDRDRDRGGSGRRDGGGGGGYRGGAGGSGRGGPGGYGGRDRDRRDDYRDSRGRDRDYQGRGPPPGATRGVSAVGQLSETLQAKVQVGGQRSW
jgi:hypothetical protein